MAVQWTPVSRGISKRLDRNGRPIYRARIDRGPGASPRWLTETFRGATTLNARRAAEQWLADTKAKIGRGEVPSADTMSLTLQGAYDRLHAAGRYSPATLASHASLWSALQRADAKIVGRKLKDIDTAMLRSTLAKITAPSMQDKVRQLVGLCYKAADLANISPASKPFTPSTREVRVEADGNGRKQRHLEDGTVERIIAAVPARYRTLIRILWRTGMRPGEAFAMTVGQIDPAAGAVVIDRAVNDGIVGLTKTGKVRRVTLPPTLLADLAEHIRTYSTWTDPDALVFSNEAGNVIDADGFRRRVWKPAADAAGATGAVMYDLRHTSVSNLLALGVDPITVAEWSGHSVAVMLKVYSHHFERAGQEAAARLEGQLASGAHVEADDAA